MAKLIQKETIELMHRGISITFIWVLGYTNIKGNEVADKSAKEAAQQKNHI